MSFFNKNKDKKKFITSADYSVCSKCGEPIKSNSRYCMKCGALNYDHPENEYMKKYVSKKEVEKINREYYEDREKHQVEDVYVGGKKLESVNINENNTDQYKPSISLYKFLLIILIAVLVIVYFMIK